MREDIREIKSRLSSIEQGIAGLRRDLAFQYGDIADIHVRNDRFDRIEKRLDIVDHD